MTRPKLDYYRRWSFPDDESKNKDEVCNLDQSALGRSARQFARHSSLHGLKYLVYCQKHMSERLLWAIICFIALILALYFSSLATIRFYEDPSIIHLARVIADFQLY